MSLRVAINGFGRIGRLVFRAALKHPEIEVAVVNASYPPATLVHLLKHDTTHGRWDEEIEAVEDGFRVGGSFVRLTSERDPSKIDWSGLGIHTVIEATGVFRRLEQAEAHLEAGAERVVLTAPPRGEGIPTIVMGVNESTYDPSVHRVVSNASCTTNCLAPVIKVIHEAFGLRQGFMTTVHALTMDQRSLDNPHKDLRRARSAFENIVPTTTGAARAIRDVMPELAGRLDGFSLRVPVTNVSLLDLNLQLESAPTRDEVNGALRAAAEGPMKNYIHYTEEPLVSSDFISDPHSAIIDGLSTMEMPGGLVKVVAWYDNEFGYASRVVDLVAYMASRGV